MESLEKFIRDVPDFPKKGIVFKDITPLLADAKALEQAVRQLCAPFEGRAVDVVTGIESRGFIFGSLVAQRLGAGFVPMRKKGKLPFKCVSQNYVLEYGVDTIEMHCDAVKPGAKVLMVDDLLATGGTMAAACKLVASCGGAIVGTAFVVELCFLEGRKKLAPYSVHSLIKVSGE
jgi:adenine phosphoribosyltransferase